MVLILKQKAVTLRMLEKLNDCIKVRNSIKRRRDSKLLLQVCDAFYYKDNGMHYSLKCKGLS